MLLTYPLMEAVQLVSAQIGRVTGRGLAHNMGQVFPRYLVLLIVAALFIANTINIGADLAAMGAASQLALGANAHVMTIVFALISLGLQIFVSYRRYASLLKWLTLVLFAYAALLFVVHLDLRGIGEGLVMYPAYVWDISIPGHDGIRARSAFQTGPASEGCFFDQALIVSPSTACHHSSCLQTSSSASDVRRGSARAADNPPAEPTPPS